MSHMHYYYDLVTVVNFKRNKKEKFKYIVML